MRADYNAGDWLEYSDAPQEDIDEYIRIVTADEAPEPAPTPQIGDNNCLFFALAALFVVVAPLLLAWVLTRADGGMW